MHPVREQRASSPLTCKVIDLRNPLGPAVCIDRDTRPDTCPQAINSVHKLQEFSGTTAAVHTLPVSPSSVSFVCSGYALSWGCKFDWGEPVEVRVRSSGFIVDPPFFDDEARLL